MASEISDAVFGVMIAAMVLLRLVRVVNRRSFESIFEMGRWEEIFLMSSMTVVSALFAYDRPDFVRWMAACFFAIATVRTAMKSPESKSENSCPPVFLEKTQRLTQRRKDAT